MGQFIDHELTLDVTSSLDRKNDPDQIKNFRTPALDLDSVYGQGMEVSRHLYDHNATLEDVPENDGSADNKMLFADYPKLFDGTLFSLGERYSGGPGMDLSRGPESGGSVALIGDFRNDENRALSQLHLLMLKFHNQAV